MAHAKDVETQKFGMQLQNIQGCHERLWVNRDDLAKELKKDKHDWKKPLETWPRLEEFGDVEDLLTFRRPNPCYTYVRCDICELSFVCCFSDSHNKIFLFKNYCLYCVYPSRSLLSHPKTLGTNRGWMEMNSYFLDQWLNWRQTNVFRTWRIIWRITL